MCAVQLLLAYYLINITSTVSIPVLSPAAAVVEETAAVCVQHVRMMPAPIFVDEYLMFIYHHLHMEEIVLF